MSEAIYYRTPVMTHSTRSTHPKEWYKPVLDYEKINSISKGKGARVAVLDDGIDREHKYLIGKIKHVFEFTSENFETGFHATHVAGIITSKKHGIFPEVELGCFKVLTAKDGMGASKWVANGIKGARIKGYEVINASLGGEINDRDIEREIRQFCGVSNFFFVCASGNDGKETDYPAALSKYISGVISVGAAEYINGEWQIATFSSAGDVTIVAPGVDILSTLPGDKEGTLSGTSMAAPFISSLIAVCKVIYPAFDHNTFNFVAERCTHKFNDLAHFGKGVIQMSEWLETVKDIANGKIIIPAEKPIVKIKVKLWDKVTKIFSSPQNL